MTSQTSVAVRCFCFSAEGSTCTWSWPCYYISMPWSLGVDIPLIAVNSVEYERRVLLWHFIRPDSSLSGEDYKQGACESGMPCGKIITPSCKMV